MNLKNKTTSMILLTLALAAGSALAAANPADLLNAGRAVGDPVAAFELRWPERTAAVVARRAAAVAETLLDRQISRSELQQALSAADELDTGWIAPFAAAPELRLRYLPGVDEIRLLNMAVIDDREPTRDIGEAAAVEIARVTLARLAEQDVVQVDDYATDFEVSYRQVGGGRKDGSETWSRVLEYRVTFLRQINGIPLANAGARVSVHASGKLAAIRLGGVEASARVDASGALVPEGVGAIRTRSVDSDSALERLAALVPADAEARLHWHRVMYVIPDDVALATVEPLMVVAYSLSYLDPLAGEVVSRRKIVGISLTDGTAAPVDFTPPAAAAATGTARTDS